MDTMDIEAILRQESHVCFVMHAERWDTPVVEFSKQQILKGFLGRPYLIDNFREPDARIAWVEAMGQKYGWFPEFYRNAINTAGDYASLHDVLMHMEGRYYGPPSLRSAIREAVRLSEVSDAVHDGMKPGRRHGYAQSVKVAVYKIFQEFHNLTKVE